MQKIVDFDAGEGHADVVEIEDFGKRIEAAKVKSVQLTDAITGHKLRKKDAIRIDDLRPAMADFIRDQYPNVRSDDYISRSAVDKYRGDFIAGLLRNERGELSVLESEVVESLQTHDTLTENIEEDYDDKRSFADRVADTVASFGGSWTFILSFFGFLAAWMALNVFLGMSGAFDPYPFILLNLILSTLAAFQAPIIMMSQRRQETKDRLRALNDYKVNLKAELEIRHLHEKVDHLLNRQWERLTEIQQVQIEMMLDQAKAAKKAFKLSSRAAAAPKQKKAKAAIKRAAGEPGPAAETADTISEDPAASKGQD